MGHMRAPSHFQPHDKIKRWYQTPKIRVLLENYYLPVDLENRVSNFVDRFGDS